MSADRLTSATIANYGQAYSGYEFYNSILLHILAKGKYTPKEIVSTSVADPDPGFGILCIFTQGSGIRIRDDYFSGSRILTTSQIQYIFKILPLKMAKKQETLNFV
jgi:hypothetical protein